MNVLAWLDSLHTTEADGAVTNRKWPEAQEARAAVAELVEAAREMMRQDAVQRATEITNPFMAGAADKLASALRKVGAR